MVSIEEENKIAFATCIEIVLMRTGNTNYNLILAKLQSAYTSWILDCVDNPEYLRTVLKEVFVDNYYTVVEEIRSESERLTDIDEIKSNFFKVMLG